ncbi:MAG TPA: DUF6152 family protein [Steroidobacteraceae bacterium]
MAGRLSDVGARRGTAVKNRWISTRAVTGACLLAGVAALPAHAHHSFAMYDQTQTLVLTGVVYQFVAQANHAELHVYLIGADGKLEKDKDGKPHSYGVEMAGAAAVAEQGITATTMPAGTIISFKVNPLRVGADFGSKVGNSAIAKCPWKTPPVPGKTCDTVQGRELLGAANF